MLRVAAIYSHWIETTSLQLGGRALYDGTTIGDTISKTASAFPTMSQPGQNPQQPISFKTVPGRNRTQKWTQAKTNNYDGDEWGSYDDYDDYGGHDEPTSAHQQQGQYGQLQRQPSFDRGIDAERRQFSSGTQQEHYTSPVGGSGRIAQDIQSPHSPDEARRRMREFSNPGQVPQPLNTPRSPQAPGSAERPPRDSSLRSDSPAAEARPIPAATSPSTNKALPFVRPSDIYKRMAEEKEKERQSSESGRPSMDAVQKDIGSPSTAQNTLTHKKSRESLPSGSPTGNSTTSPELPSITGGSAFGMHPIQTGVQPSTVSQPSAMHVQNNSTQLPPVSDVPGTGSFMPRDEEERLSATGLAASTAAAGAAASALASGSRDITPTMPSMQSQASSDPAAEIAAERTTNAPVEQLGRAPGEDPSGLSHQPSSGFRSVVHKAFDGQGDGSTPDSPISRENTHSVVSRTDTNSTRSISPIMSRVPSAATAQQRQQERDAVVPSIAEEEPLEIARSRPMSGATTQTVTSRPSILRKPTPNHSRNVSSEVAGFTPGYRRSMETPSPNNSPARTPGIADVDTRRFSGPMAAETVTTAEPPDVSPDAPEAPSATLEPVETPSETPDPTIVNGDASEVVKPLPTTGRGRSGTNYSLRESDLAKEVSNSPEERSAVAEAAANERQLFLDTHPVGPASPRTMSPTALSPTALSPTGYARPFPHPAASGSGRNSPAGNSRSRVRNIVDQFHQIDEDSRRNSAASSKSSWSNFAGEDDPSPGIVKRTTGGSMLSQESPAETSMFPSYDNADQDGAAASSTIRPEPERQESFRPHLPGEWVSATATPASEVPSVPAPDIFRGRDQTSRDITPTANPTPKADQVASPGEEVDLTPTTKKTKLPSNDRAVSGENDNPLSAVKDAGEALGTALMSHMGYGHQTQDFASKDKPAPVDIPEMQPHRPTGNIDDYMNPPQLNREHSDAPSEATNSVANSIPPTPLSKGTPEPAGLGVAAAPPSEGRPVSNYFSGYNPDAPAPLSFGKNSPRTTPREFESERPTVLPTMSTDTGTGDFESDRLRKDIVRSLSPGKMAELKREGALDDVARTQDALDAPTNERRVASGESALPAAETKNSDARSGLPSQSRPGLLGQRFSWENRSADDDLYGHMAVVGETKGDENRESFGRPHSNGGLHVVNTEVQAADSEPTTAEAGKQSEPGFLLSEPADAEKRLSASLPVGTTALATGNQSDTLPELSSPIAEDPTRSLDHVAPTPITEDDTAPTNLAPPPPPSDLKEDSPTIPSSYTAATTKPNPSTTSQKDKDKDRIPPFRDLAAIKSVPDRIAAYEHTRGRFANMNTGLNGWLSTMLAANPEYADAANQKYEGPAVIQSSGIGGTISGLGLGGTIRGHGHKHSPSILKIGGGGAGGGERKGSAASLGTSSAAGTGMPESSSGGGSGGGGHVDVEKMQAKGKDFLKGAGAGAKGLFAKGKSRFGRSEKVE